jgi:hypothetical protein
MRSMTLALLIGCAAPEPGDAPPESPREAPPFALRRLNQAEYDHTVADLLGTAQRPALDFPPDDAAHGFDNAESALATSPLLVEMWESAAARLAKEALRRPLRAPIDLTLEGESGALAAAEEGCNGPFDGGFALWCGGAARVVWTAPVLGAYRLSVRAQSQPAGEDHAQLSITVDGVNAITAPIPAAPEGGDGWTTVEVEVKLLDGPREILVGFDNDFYDELTGADRNLILDHLRIEGPVDFTYTPNPVHERVFVCEPDGQDRAPRDCAREIVTALLPRAWRRPVTDAEIDRHLARFDEVVAAGDPADWGVEFMVRQILTSPEFVYIVEAPADPAIPDRQEIGPFELANRLSYALWESMPDDELTAAAADGSLTQDAVLEAQVERLLRDPRAAALTDDFAGQWLGMRMVQQTTPDTNVFTTFTPAVHESMVLEMNALFSSFVGTDRDLVELLTTEWAEIDGPLARFYGIDFQRTSGTQQFNLSRYNRGGWLAQAGLLMATSYPTRTSPVRRGVWVLGNLLCDEPDPPPGDVPGFPEPSTEALTVRDRLAAHRANPACSGCHNRIDPVGLPFEEFDGVGLWRDEEGGEPIDASGELPGYGPVHGVRELSAAIAQDPRFTHCMVDRFFTWSHHRAPTELDAPWIDAAVERFRAEGRTFDALVKAVVLQPSFRARQPRAAAGGAE